MSKIAVVSEDKNEYLLNDLLCSQFFFPADRPMLIYHVINLAFHLFLFFLINNSL